MRLFQSENIIKQDGNNLLYTAGAIVQGTALHPAY